MSAVPKDFLPSASPFRHWTKQQYLSVVETALHHERCNDRVRRTLGDGPLERRASCAVAVLSIWALRPKSVSALAAVPAPRKRRKRRTGYRLRVPPPAPPVIIPVMPIPEQVDEMFLLTSLPPARSGKKPSLDWYDLL